MKRGIISLCITLVLLCAIGTPAAAAVQDTGFSDVAADAWYTEAVEYCVANELMSGVSTTRFAPDTVTSRAMLVTILHRQAGTPETAETRTFSDVKTDSWYEDAVYWALAEELVTGYSDGTFRPNQAVTREQIVTIIWRFAGRPESNGATDDFADESNISSYAKAAVDWAQENAIISGKTGNRFDPRGRVTRAETASVLYNYLGSVDLPDNNASEEISEQQMIDLSITVGNKEFLAKLYNNETTQALAEQMPITINMSELGGKEKYYYFDGSLPTNAERVGSIKNDDLMLYGSDCLVLFYEDFETSYSYTRLGYIEDVSGLAAALGSGSVTITFERK